jgi:hypothetical protein
MGEAACGLLEAELALDRVAGELARELPAHVRGFARAYAAGQPTPPAPAITHRPATLATVRQALVHSELADRALALLRVVAPIGLEGDPRVAAARAAPRTWPGYAALVAARDAVTRDRLGQPHLAVVHALHGVAEAPPASAAIPAPVAGWITGAGPSPSGEIEDTWHALAAAHGARGTCTIVRAAVRPRAFVIEPGREVTIVVPRELVAPAARFAALHELGHALGALIRAEPAGLPRVVDEAVAAYVARLLEIETPLAPGWASPLAARARSRRLALARALGAIEHGGAPPDELERPPWALWHDPGAQAAYAAAEAIADRWWAELGPAPGPGVLARASSEEVARRDRISLATLG